MQANLRDNVVTNEPVTLKKFLTFTVDGKEYGVDLSAVQEIKVFEQVTSLPNTADCILGVMNLRGSITPIMDLRARFSFEPTTDNPRNVVIILKFRGANVGVLVGSVTDIVEVREEDIAKTNTSLSFNIDEDYISGIISTDSNIIVCLNIDYVFDEESILAAHKTHQELIDENFNAAEDSDIKCE